MAEEIERQATVRPARTRTRGITQHGRGNQGRSGGGTLSTNSGGGNRGEEPTNDARMTEVSAVVEPVARGVGLDPVMREARARRWEELRRNLRARAHPGE